MAISTPTRHAWRALIGLLGLTLVLFGANAAGVHVFKEGTWVPELALDLQGGTQIVMEADTDGATPTDEQMAQAVEIIRQRVDASGVSEAQITTQGSDNLVVALPGNPDQAQRERIEASAQMQLRPVLYASNPATTFVGDDGESTPYPTPDPTLADEPTAEPTDPSDLNWVTDKMYAEMLAYNCEAEDNDPAHAPHDEPLITCEADGSAKYILGPVEIDGSDIVDAQAGVNQDNGSWLVSIDFDKSASDGEKSGADKFAEISQRLVNLTGVQNQFAFVLDGNVISAPGMNQAITGGSAQISGGGITEESAKVLADQLRFGALPMTFNVISSDTISATLGSQQLMIGLVAGLIGLVLVAAWVLLVSYRALGFVIIASLAVMAILTFVMLCLLSWRIDYRLSLAGVAGLIVTIGFTADSFIVYFERIRDELPRWEVAVRGRRGRLGAREAHDLQREIDQRARRRRAVHHGGRHGEGLRVHARPDDRDRHRHLRAVHPPGDAAAGAHAVLRRRSPAVGPGSERARRRAHQPYELPQPHRGQGPRAAVPRRGREAPDDRRAQARGTAPRGGRR